MEQKHDLMNPSHQCPQFYLLHNVLLWAWPAAVGVASAGGGGAAFGSTAGRHTAHFFSCQMSLAAK